MSARPLAAAMLTLVAGPASAGTVRLGLFVGNDAGFGEDELLRHAEREARDLAKLFAEMGGIAPARAQVLQGAKVEEFKDAVASIEAQVREIEAGGDEVLLLFYYSGHASRQGLHLGGSLLEMEWLRRWLETSQAQVRIAFVDACESGTLARTRGGTPGEAIEITVDDALTASGLAIITSTGPLSVARESDSFGGGVFSRALLTGLRGSADLDGDGSITLKEAYKHTFTETVISSASSGETVQKPEFRLELSGIGEVALTRIHSTSSGLVLPEELEGVYTVVSVATGQVVARVDKSAGEMSRLSLPSGRYVVRKVRREDVLVAELDLVWGGDRWVDDAQMTSLPVGDPLIRGGWTARPVQLALRGTFSSPIAAANPVMGGGELALRFQIAPVKAPALGIVVGGGYEQGMRWTYTGRLRSGQGRVMVALIGERRLDRIDLKVGGGVQGLLLHQILKFTEPDGTKRIDFERETLTYWSFGPFAQIGLHLPVGPHAGLELGVRGTFFPVEVDGTRGFFATAQVFGGVGFRFGGRALGQVQRKKD
ncbi:MAG: hypothetical protein GY898_10450 [Proteobacteria bacterium]|nr:hypothetical protein [Pseudomonadota bacterium]